MYNNIRMKIYLPLVSFCVSVLVSSCIPVVMDGPPPIQYGEPVIIPYQAIPRQGGYPQSPTHYGGPGMPQSTIGGFMPGSWQEAKARGW